MNGALWVLVGWLFGCVMFLFGCWWTGARTDHWRARALVAEATTDHARCQGRWDAQAHYINRLEQRIDEYRGGADIADEVEEYLRDGGT